MPVSPPATLSEAEWQQALKDVAARIQTHLPQLVRKPVPPDRPPVPGNMDASSAQVEAEAEAEAEDVSMDMSREEEDYLEEEDGRRRDGQKRGGDDNGVRENREEEPGLFVSEDSDSGEEGRLRAASALNEGQRLELKFDPLPVFRFPEVAPTTRQPGPDRDGLMTFVLRPEITSVESDYSSPPPLLGQVHDTSIDLNILDITNQTGFLASYWATKTGSSLDNQTRSPSPDGGRLSPVSTTKTRPDIYAAVPRNENSIQIRHRAAKRLARPGHESQTWLRASKAPTEPPSIEVIVLSKHDLEVATFEYVRDGHFTTSDRRQADPRPGGPWSPFSWLLMAACIWAGQSFWEHDTVRRFPGRKPNTITVNLNLIQERIVAWFEPREGWNTGGQSLGDGQEAREGLSESKGASGQTWHKQSKIEKRMESRKHDGNIEATSQLQNTELHEVISLDTDTDESGSEQMRSRCDLPGERPMVNIQQQHNSPPIVSDLEKHDKGQAPRQGKLKEEAASNSCRSKTDNPKISHRHPSPTAEPRSAPAATLPRGPEQPAGTRRQIQPNSSVKRQTTSASGTQSTKTPEPMPSKSLEPVSDIQLEMATAPSSTVPGQSSTITVSVEPEAVSYTVLQMAEMNPVADEDPDPDAIPFTDQDEAGYKHYLGLVEYRDWLVGVQRMSRPSDHFDRRAEAIRTVVREIKNVLHAKPGLMEGLRRSLEIAQEPSEDDQTGSEQETDNEDGQLEEEQQVQEDGKENSDEGDDKGKEKKKKKKKKKERKKREKGSRSQRSEKRQAESEDEIEGTMSDKSAEPKVGIKKSKKKPKTKRGRDDGDEEEEERPVKKRRKKERKEKVRLRGE